MKKDKIKYIVKKEEGVVICIIEDPLKDIERKMKNDIDNINRYFSRSDNNVPIFTIDIDTVSGRLIGLKQVKGVAKCSDKDEFDENKGKKIALLKAKQKTYESMIKYLRKLFNHLEKYYKSFEQRESSMIIAGYNTKKELAKLAN